MNNSTAQTSQTQRPDDGGQAFPCPHSPYESQSDGSEGMTLRDYFAAKAMQSMVVGPPIDRLRLPGEEPHQAVARLAYAMADTMIAARKGAK